MQTTSYQSAAGFIAARTELVRKLREHGINDAAVLSAIMSVPREEFVPLAFRHRAYDDDALPIDRSQTISQPRTVAIMSQLLVATPGMKVLEIGTGSGYQAAVLAAMGLRVFTIERHRELLREAQQRLERIGCNVATLHGDGSLGWSAFAPFERIMVTAGAPEIPSSLLKQLAPDGRLIIPVGGRDSQQMQAVVRLGEANEYDVFEYGDFKFVPLIGRKGWGSDQNERSG